MSDGDEKKPSRRPRTKRGRALAKNSPLEMRYGKIAYVAREVPDAYKTKKGGARRHAAPAVSLVGDRDLVAGMDKVKLPPPPTHHSQQEAQLHAEQQCARVEILMLKGIRDETQIKELLGIDTMVATRKLIARVHARWEITAGHLDIKKSRGQAVKTLELIEQELWSVVGNSADDVRGKIVALDTLMKVQDRKLPLLGINPKSIEAHNDSASRAAYTQRTVDHATLAQIATRFKTLLAPQSQVIEHESE